MEFSWMKASYKQKSNKNSNKLISPCQKVISLFADLISLMNLQIFCKFFAFCQSGRSFFGRHGQCTLDILRNLILPTEIAFQLLTHPLWNCKNVSTFFEHSRHCVGGHHLCVQNLGFGSFITLNSSSNSTSFGFKFWFFNICPQVANLQ